MNPRRVEQTPLTVHIVGMAFTYPRPLSAAAAGVCALLSLSSAVASAQAARDAEVPAAEGLAAEGRDARGRDALASEVAAASPGASGDRARELSAPQLVEPSLHGLDASGLEEEAGEVPSARRGPRRASPALIARMEAQLTDRARSERTSSIINGVVGLATGGALFGASLWLSVDEDAFGAGFGTPNPAAITGFSVSPMLLAMGIYSLIGIGSDGDRLLRWRAAMNGELSALELGRFEGELRAEANAARVSRWATTALGVGILAGGAATMVLGGALDGFDDEFRAVIVGTGGAYLVIGAVLTGTSFLESSVEQMWNQYRSGEESPPLGFTIQPVLGPGSVGIVGTF